MFCSRLFIALYKAESVPESGGAARAAAAACCLVANIPAFMGHGTRDMYGTWDMYGTPAALFHNLFVQSGAVERGR